MNETTGRRTSRRWQIAAVLTTLALLLFLPFLTSRTQAFGADTGAQKDDGKNMTITNDGKAPYRVVVDVSGEGQDRWIGVLRNIENLRAALGPQNVEIEVVVYGKALPLLVRPSDKLEANADAQDLARQVGSLAESGVRFVACENSLRRAKVTREMLLPSVSTTDSGVAELVRKQHDGWAYLKPGS